MKKIKNVKKCDQRFCLAVGVAAIPLEKGEAVILCFMSFEATVVLQL